MNNPIGNSLSSGQQNTLSPSTSVAQPASQTRVSDVGAPNQNSNPLVMLEKLGLPIGLLSGVDSQTRDAIELVARTHAEKVEAVEAAARAAKFASGLVRTKKKEFATYETTLRAEAAVLIEAARSAAEERGNEINTMTAIRAAIKTAKTSRQQFALLFRLQTHQKTLAEKMKS